LSGSRRRAGARGPHRGCCYLGAAMDGEERGDEPDELDDDDDGSDLDDDREGAAESVTVEISGLSLYTHHGASEAEREGVWVKAAKPEPPIALSVDEVSVEVWREAE